MAACVRCGAETGTFSGAQCGRCVAHVADARTRWMALFHTLTADRFLDSSEEARLRQHQHELGLSDADMAPVMPQLMRAKVLSAAASAQAAPIDFPGLSLAPGDRVFWWCDATVTLQEERTEWVKGFQGRRGYNRTVQTPVQGACRCVFTSSRLLCQGTVINGVFRWENIKSFVHQPGSVIVEAERRAWFRVEDAELFAAHVHGLSSATKHALGILVGPRSQR